MSPADPTATNPLLTIDVGKSAANLAANPDASIILTDPLSGNEYRLTIEYERTERRGPTFEQLKGEVDEIAALTGQIGVFRLRSADIYKVVQIGQIGSS